MSNLVVQSLWIGDSLSLLERLSISSFLKNGHEYHLYSYGPIQNVPSGTIIKNAEEIIPSHKIFRYGAAAGQGKGSYSGFSNYFRFKLLHERGGYWVDTDVVCLKFFDFEQDYVFSSELWPEDKPSMTSSCLMKAPRNSEFTHLCWAFCNTKDPNQLAWGETGPDLVTRAIKVCNLAHLVKPFDTFCPITFFEMEKFIEPNPNIYLGNSYAIHFWNEEWRRRAYDKDTSYHPDSLYEKLKLQYL